MAFNQQKSAALLALEARHSYHVLPDILDMSKCPCPWILVKAKKQGNPSYVVWTIKVTTQDDNSRH